MMILSNLSFHLHLSEFQRRQAILIPEFANEILRRGKADLFTDFSNGVKRIEQLRYCIAQLYSKNELRDRNAALLLEQRAEIAGVEMQCLCKIIS